MKKEITWEQMADILIRDFQKGTYKDGEKMPSEQKMAERFLVTRTEVRKAYERLKEMGYIYSMQGYGSFFSGKKEKIRLFMNDSSSFTEKMNAIGVRYETRLISFQKVKEPAIIRTMMNLNEWADIFKLTRLRLIDEQPAAIHTSYLSSAHFPEIEKEAPGINSLYDFIKSKDYQNLTSENVQLTVSTPTKKERTLLDIKGYASSLVLSCKSVDNSTGITLEVGRTVYRSDKFVFQL